MHHQRPYLYLGNDYVSEWLSETTSSNVTKKIDAFLVPKAFFNVRPFKENSSYLRSIPLKPFKHHNTNNQQTQNEGELGGKVKKNNTISTKKIKNSIKNMSKLANSVYVYLMIYCAIIERNEFIYWLGKPSIANI